MNFLIYFLIAILGTVIGSFLNVVICRFNTGRSVAKGRSICFSCSTTLKWYELIPLVSFIMQLGKCRTCRNKISFQYPIVEFLTAIIFTLTAYKLSNILSVSYSSFVIITTVTSFIFCLWIVMLAYDIKHKIIPDILSYTSFFSAVVLSGIIWGPDAIAPTLLASFVVALPFALLFFLSKGKWMGFGDAKIALSIGALLGISAGFTALMIAFWIGAVFSIIILLLGKTKWGLKTEIPFAPFLMISSWIVFFLSLNFDKLINLFIF